jgi:radical SAM superfamily enzyme YgiQ (UPF0313 family)
MDKACTVESNARAIDLCRKHGLTTVASLIVGFPGETRETLARTLDFLRHHPPDFFFLAPFSTRATGVPLLTDANRERFQLATANHLRTGAPYWRHRSMSCVEMGAALRDLHRAILSERISLHGALFNHRLLDYRPEERAALLDQQSSITKNSPVAARIFDRLNAIVDSRLARDVAACLPAKDAPVAPQTGPKLHYLPKA